MVGLLVVVHRWVRRSGAGRFWSGQRERPRSRCGIAAFGGSGGLHRGPSMIEIPGHELRATRGDMSVGLLRTAGDTALRRADGGVRQVKRPRSPGGDSTAECHPRTAAIRRDDDHRRSGARNGGRDLAADRDVGHRRDLHWANSFLIARTPSRLTLGLRDRTPPSAHRATPFPPTGCS